MIKNTNEVEIYKRPLRLRALAGFVATLMSLPYPLTIAGGLFPLKKEETSLSSYYDIFTYNDVYTYDDVFKYSNTYKYTKSEITIHQGVYGINERDKVGALLEENAFNAIAENVADKLNDIKEQAENRNEKVVSERYEIEEVELIGNASDEYNGDEAIGRPDEYNLELAKKRTENALEQFQAEMKKKGIQVGSYITSYRENVLTKEQVEAFDALVKQCGYKDMTSVVKALASGEPIDDDAKRAAFELFVKKRGIDVKVKAKIIVDIEGEEPVEVKTKREVVVPRTGVNTRTIVNTKTVNVYREVLIPPFLWQEPPKLSIRRNDELISRKNNLGPKGKMRNGYAPIRNCGRTNNVNPSFKSGRIR